MTSHVAQCAVCGSSDWRQLPDAGRGRSVTTGGALLQHPIAKSQCVVCALVQRTGEQYLATTDYYETAYGFYERPRAAHFDRQRYAAMGEWIREAVPHAPRNALDAGCGRGWMLEVMQPLFPGTAFTGVEPSLSESQNGRDQGLNILTGRIGPDLLGDGSYDFIYTTNVLEHTESPVSFLADLNRLLTKDGVIVVTCPDASEPGAEVMFSDQNFSVLPGHLAALGHAAGLEMVVHRGSPGHVSLRDKQLAVFKKLTGGRPGPPAWDRQASAELFDRRAKYFLAWQSCNSYLREQCQGARSVYNFGTSTWAFLLAGYCPDYWSLVTSCVVDGGTGRFLGKPVADGTLLALSSDDVLVLGVNPPTQSHYFERFSRSGARIVRWDSIITR